MTTFPATESTLSTHHLGQFLIDHYYLSSSTSCKLFRTGMNHLYIVSDGEQKFVFRVYTYNWRTKVEVAEEVRLLNHLENQGVSIAHPVADKMGEFIHEFNAPEGVRYGVLFSFAQGRKIPRFDENASYQIGGAMAKMHLATNDFSLDRVTYDSTTLLSEALDRTKLFFDNDLEDVMFMERMTHFLESQFEEISVKEIRHGAVHLDMWFDNMHINEQNEVTIFDFDFCGNGWLCLDISYFLYQLLNTNLNPADYELKARSFLDGYESITKIPDEEKRILPFVCLGIMNYFMSMQCDRFDVWTNIFLTEDHLRRYVSSLKRWIAHNHLPIH